jgi:hypothetical protein
MKSLGYCLLLAVGVANAQQHAFDAAALPRTGHDLLNRAYALSRDLNDRQRKEVEVVASRFAARYDPPLAAVWAANLWRVGDESKLSGLKSEAVDAASGASPDIALQLLLQTPIPARPPRPEHGVDPRIGAARKLFPRYWGAHGLDGVPQLRAAAKKLGETGQYPYWAAGEIARLANKPEISAAFFRDALEHFNKKAGFANDDIEFLQFFEQAHAVMAAQDLRSGLRAYVKALALDEAHSNDAVTRVNTDQGSFQFTTGREKLFRALPLIREADAVWANELMGRYPDVDRPVAADARVLSREPLPPGSPNNGDSLATIQRVEALSFDDPERALAIARAIPDRGQQVAALALAAGGIMAIDRPRGHHLLMDALSQGRLLPCAKDRLLVLASATRAAANANDPATAELTLDEAFRLEETMLRPGPDGDLPGLPSEFWVLRPAVFATARADEAGIANLVELVTSSYLRARYYITGAEGAFEGERARKTSQ